MIDMIWVWVWILDEAVHPTSGKDDVVFPPRSGYVLPLMWDEDGVRQAMV